MFINYHGFNVRVKQVELSHTANAVSTSDLTTYTFSTQALGAAHSNRRIAVFISGSAAASGRTISTVTINSASAAVVSDGVTSASADGGGGSTTRLSALWIATVPTGTTGDIVITFSGAVERCAISVYRLLNTGTTAHHVANDTTITSNAFSTSLNIPGSGAAIGGVAADGNSAARTWTATNITENVDATIEGNHTYSTASGFFTTPETGRTITFTASGALNDGAMVTASFRPQ